jgi:hypothetical protein
VPGVNGVRTERRQYRPMEDQMQLAAMHRVLWNRVAGRNSARLLPDLLTELVDVDEFSGLDAAGGYGKFQSKFLQHQYRTRL